jgi:hypothetical protein
MSPSDVAVQERVIDAVNEADGGFRTVLGIAKETGYDPEVVEEALELRPDAVRLSHALDPHGHLIYTRKDTPISLRERVTAVLQMAALA